MKNIEIKTPLRDRPAAERRLEGMGARNLWTKVQKDTFFRVERGWLKLREADETKPELISYSRSTEYSGPRESNYDVMPLSDAETWKRLLGRVLPVDKVVRKERTLWVYEHTRVHLDRVDTLGDYLELETVVMDIDPDEAKQESERIIFALALEPREFISVPYRDLMG
ncbi:MAG: class IV adenylate cyclase [Planctomycetota bacterium]|nr:class IV adenylate cyclase [Planctomycetota bacterium]